MITYDDNVPLSTNNPSIDQPDMLNNTRALFNIWPVDHFGFNEANSGQHEQITMYNQSPPALGLANGQLYCSGGNPFWQSAGPIQNQLAFLGVNSFSTNGYISLGGLIFQWGIVNGTHGGKNYFNSGDTGTITFAAANTSFPNNCFGVWTNLLWNSNTVSSPSQTASVTIDLFTLSKISFTWLFPQNSNQYNRFFWMAIGN